MRAQCTIDHRRWFCLCKQQHLRFAWIVSQKGVNVCTRYVDYAVAYELKGWLLKRVDVHFFAWVLLERKSRDRVWRIYLVAREGRDLFFVANRFEFFTVQTSNSEHAFVLQRKLLILTLVPSRCRILQIALRFEVRLTARLVELNDWDALFPIVGDLLREVHSVVDCDLWLDSVVHRLGTRKPNDESTSCD